ncbi:MAG: class I SAM-dependent methyltransferase [Gemmatimonadota bacterium]
MNDQVFYTNAHYPRLARARGWYRHLLTKPRFQAIRRTGCVHSDLRVLEVGCDNGTLLRMLENTGAFGYGIDLNGDALRLTEHPRVTRGRADALPFSDNAFDLCVASHVIEHLESPRRFLHESSRVLSKRGKLILIYPWELVRGITTIPDIVLSGQVPSLALMRRIHRHCITPARLRHFAHKTGLRHERSTVFLGLPNLAVQILTVLAK